MPTTESQSEDVPGAHPKEPAQPQRGLTLEERGRDVSVAQADAEAESSTPRRILKSASLPFVISQADGYPMVIKQFLQFCLIVIYPGWVFAVLVGVVFYFLVWMPCYFVLWLIFWPLRAWMKKHHREDYAASQRK